MKLVTAFVFFVIFLLFDSVRAEEEYQRFDAQVYNGLFYPNIDIIEWGEPTHLEFQIYDKQNKIDVNGRTVEVNGRYLFEIVVDFTFRGERRCRRIPAPEGFKPGQRLFTYINRKDKDMNNIIISRTPMSKEIPYFPKPYEKCQELAAVGHRDKEGSSQEIKKNVAESKRMLPVEKKDGQPQKYIHAREIANESKDRTAKRREVPSSKDEMLGPRTIFDENSNNPKVNKELDLKPTDFSWFGE